MKVFAHRGYSGCFPENTMLAFRQAAEAKADGIELDVQLTKDGTVVVIHDEKVDRTTDGTGNVRDFTYNELRKLNAAKVWNGKFAPEAIPSFEEYCEWVATTDLVTNIELKTGIVYYKDIEQKTIDLVAKYGLEKKIIFSSFNHMSIIKTKEIIPSIPVGALVENAAISVNSGYYCKQFGFEYFHPCWRDLNDEAVKELKENGIGFNVWTVNGMQELEQLYKWGATTAITNFPAVARAYVDGMKK